MIKNAEACLTPKQCWSWFEPPKGLAQLCHHSEALKSLSATKQPHLRPLPPALGPGIFFKLSLGVKNEVTVNET